MSGKPKLLYLLAPSYSGTTLLTYLLSQHKRIATVGELKATRMGDIDQYRCSCGTMIKKCEFWLELQMVTANQGIRFSVGDFATVFGSTNRAVNRVIRATVRGPCFEALRFCALAVTPKNISKLRDVARRNFILSQAICGLQEGDIFLDGSKDPVRLLHLIRSSLWDVRVICMQRDGRGVANSFRRHDALSFDAAVDYWLRTVRELGHMRSRIGDSCVFDARYEELCQRPERVMEDIWSWLGIEYQPLRALNSTCGKSHVLGNSMRLRNVSEIRYDDAWKAGLSAAELDLFERKAGRANRNLGYE
jgi:hypothetical protein